MHCGGTRQIKKDHNCARSRSQSREKKAWRNVLSHYSSTCVCTGYKYKSEKACGIQEHCACTEFHSYRKSFFADHGQCVRKSGMSHTRTHSRMHSATGRREECSTTHWTRYWPGQPLKHSHASVFQTPFTRGHYSDMNHYLRDTVNASFLDFVVYTTTDNLLQKNKTGQIWASSMMKLLVCCLTISFQISTWWYCYCGMLFFFCIHTLPTTVVYVLEEKTRKRLCRACTQHALAWILGGMLPQHKWRGPLLKPFLCQKTVSFNYYCWSSCEPNMAMLSCVSHTRGAKWTQARCEVMNKIHRMSDLRN